MPRVVYNNCIKRYDTAMQEKQLLRKQLIARRKQLTNQEVSAATKQIIDRAISDIEWGGARYAHIYTGQTDWNEIGTKRLITILRKFYPELVISTSDSAPNSPLPTGQYDIIIVPVLGFDANNYRLGLGQGWYDRFLATQPQAYKVGLAYAWARVTKLPHESHDIQLDDIFAA
jgi:5-formyltetrahydrofolate cyclo-ligase